MRRNCSNCRYSCCGRRDALSDICDGCTSDPDTGWYGFTDHSFSDENGSPLHFDSEEEQDAFYDAFDDDEGYMGW